MKRESKDSRSQKGLHGEVKGQEENLRVGSPAGSPSGAAGDDLVTWSKDDFEAALPLYVGGDLDRAEAARVDAWLVAHPEDQEALAASEAAAGVLARYAEVSRQRGAPDLWAGIRAEMVRGRLLEGNGRTHTPILGGPRWFQRKSVAAAAALLLTGSAGLFMMSRGAEESPPTILKTAAAADRPAQDSAPAPGVRRVTNEEPLVAVMGTNGHPLGVMAVGSQHWPDKSASGGKTQRLQRPGPGAERLIDDAPNVRIWQFAPWVEPSLVQRRGLDGAQLTSGH